MRLHFLAVLLLLACCSACDLMDNPRTDFGQVHSQILQLIQMEDADNLPALILTDLRPDSLKTVRLIVNDFARYDGVQLRVFTLESREALPRNWQLMALPKNAGSLLSEFPLYYLDREHLRPLARKEKSRLNSTILRQRLAGEIWGSQSFEVIISHRSPEQFLDVNSLADALRIEAGNDLGHYSGIFVIYNPTTLCSGQEIYSFINSSLPPGKKALVVVPYWGIKYMDGYYYSRKRKEFPRLDFVPAPPRLDLEAMEMYRVNLATHVPFKVEVNEEGSASAKFIYNQCPD